MDSCVSTVSARFDLLSVLSVYKAVYAVAHALHSLEHCQPGRGPFNGTDCADISSFQPWQVSHSRSHAGRLRWAGLKCDSLPQLMYYLKNVRYTVPHTGEDIFFDDGDVEGFYDIINWQFSSDGEISYVTVGHFNASAAPEEQMRISNDSIRWNNDAQEVSTLM